MLIDRRTFAAGLLLSGCASPPRASGDQASLEAAVAGVRARFGLVSLAAYVSLNGATLAETAQGARVLGRPTPVTTRDLWHIGSCFKAQTATLLARLIQTGAAAWETTLPDIFPERAHAMHPDARRIALWHLVSSTAGLPENPSLRESEEEQVEDVNALIAGASDDPSRRLRVLDRFTSIAPRTMPGSAWRYSNTGFILAGACADRLGGAPFENLIRREVWAPLGMNHAAFGAPSGPRAPWGHRPEGEALIPLPPDDPDSDNPSVFNSAGCAHMPFADWARFAHDQLRGAQGQGRLLSREAYARLHTPVLEGSPYALGWGAQVRDGALLQLTHNGSNGFWFADIRIYPQTGYVFLMATNDGRDIHEAAARDLRHILVERYAPIPPA